MFASTTTRSRRLLPVPALRLGIVIWKGAFDTLPDVDCRLFRTGAAFEMVLVSVVVIVVVLVFVVVRVVVVGETEVVVVVTVIVVGETEVVVSVILTV